MKQEQRKALIKLAAEMALCNQMPSRYYADWDWPKGMQVTSWRKVFDAAQKARKPSSKNSGPLS